MLDCLAIAFLSLAVGSGAGCTCVVFTGGPAVWMDRMGYSMVIFLGLFFAAVAIGALR